MKRFMTIGVFFEGSLNGWRGILDSQLIQWNGFKNEVISYTEWLVSYDTEPSEKLFAPAKHSLCANLFLFKSPGQRVEEASWPSDVTPLHDHVCSNQDLFPMGTGGNWSDMGLHGTETLQSWLDGRVGEEGTTSDPGPSIEAIVRWVEAHKEYPNFDYISMTHGANLPFSSERKSATDRPRSNICRMHPCNSI